MTQPSDAITLPVRHISVSIEVRRIKCTPFVLFRRPGMSDAEFRADANQVEQDLRKLKELLER